MIPLMLFIAKVNVAPGQVGYQVCALVQGNQLPIGPTAADPIVAARAWIDSLATAGSGAAPGGIHAEAAEEIIDRLAALDLRVSGLEGLELAAAPAAPPDEAEAPLEIPEPPPLPEPADRRPVRVPELSREEDEPHTFRGGAFRPGKDEF